MRGSIVMGPAAPEAETSTPLSQFTDKTPPTFDGHTVEYSSYRDDVLLWSRLTTLPDTKQGPAIIGRLVGEPKKSAKSVNIDDICSEKGVEKILERLDKSYAIDATSQLDVDLANFLDYHWDKTLSVDQFIAGFHSRLDKISSLCIDEKLKGHLLLRQANLDMHERNIILGSASGQYEAQHITKSIRNSFRTRSPYDSTMSTTAYESNNHPHANQKHKQKFNRRNTMGSQTPRASTNARPPSENQSSDVQPTFFALSPPDRHWLAAIIDTGACGSIVGNETLNSVRKALGLEELDKSPAHQEYHRFGNHTEDQKSLYSIKLPFFEDSEKNRAMFHVSFDVLEGDLPFLIGLPSLTRMGACINLSFNTIGMRIGAKYHKFKIFKKGHHVCLPFTFHKIPRIEATHHSSHSYYTSPRFGTPVSYSQQKDEPISGNAQEKKRIKRIHLHLRHGAKTAIMQYLRLAEKITPYTESLVAQVVHECPCQFGVGPKQHQTVSVSPPEIEKQAHISMDILYFSQIPFLHTVDHSTGWSEIGKLGNRSMVNVIRTFQMIQTFRHGPPNVITADGEFDNAPFKHYCDEIESNLIIVSPDDHEGNGIAERANRSIRECFNRIRATNMKAYLPDIVLEAAYGKNITIGSKIASSYELLYGHRPRIGDLEEGQHKDNDQLLNDQIKRKSVQKLNTMNRSNVRPTCELSVGDHAYFWRDKKGWVGPSIVQKITPNYARVTYNGTEFLSSLNRVMKAPKESKEVDKHNTASNIMCDECSSDEYQEDLIARNTISEDIGTQSTSPRVCAATNQPSSPQNNSHLPSPHDIHNLAVIADHGAPHEPHFNREQSSGLRKEATQRLEDAEQILGYVPETTGEDGPRTRSSSKCSSEIAPSNFSESITHYQTNKTCLDISQVSSMALSLDEKKYAYLDEKHNWEEKNAFIRINRNRLPPGSNLIGSHVIYKRKDNGKPKARIVPWGHRDTAKNDLRCDSPCLNLEILRLMLSIAAEQRWEIGQMDVKAAFLQSKGFNRDVYIRPPKEEDDKETLWKLTAAAYGLADSGRLWYLTSDRSLTQSYGLTRSKYEATLYYKNSSSGQLVFLLVTQVDNYIYGGQESEIYSFEKFLQQEFHIGELDRGTFAAMGAEIVQRVDHSIRLTQVTKMDDILPPNIDTKEKDRPAIPAELHNYRSIIGKMLFVGRLSQPIMLFHASFMASKTNRLMKHHLKELRALLVFDKKTTPTLEFKSPSIQDNKFSLEVYTDAAVGAKNDMSGRLGYVIYRRCGDTTHPIHWGAHKLRRVARSSATAEILAASEGTSAVLYLQSLLAEIQYAHDTVLVTDSKSVYNLVTSIREPTETLNKVDLSAMREAFNNGSLSQVRWTPGIYHVADALTKDNRHTGSLLLKTLREGTYAVHPDSLNKDSITNPES